jgi:hypothetical protein
MAQICPDCKSEWSDSTNYCGMCLAKLPNAAVWLPDYKKISTLSEGDKHEIPKLFGACLDDTRFKELLLLKILMHAFELKKSEVPRNDKFSDVVLILFLDELIDAYRSGRLKE